MELTLAITDATGHAEVAFDDNAVRVKWDKTSAVDRTMIKDVIARGKKLGLSPCATDAAGKPTEPTKKLPGRFFNKDGELVLLGAVDGIRKLAKSMVEEEIAAGRLVFEAQPSGEWKALKPGKFEPKKEKQTVTSHAPVVGG